MFFYAPNCDYAAIAYIGIMIAGGVACGTLDSSPFREAFLAVVDSDSKFIICGHESYPMTKQIVKECKDIKVRKLDLLFIFLLFLSLFILKL